MEETGEAVGSDRPLGSGLLRRRTIFFSAAAGFLLLAALVFLYREELAGGVEFLARIQEKKERFRNWIFSFGAWGPLVFIGVQIFQVVFSPIPGELTGFLGGYIYGVWLATLYSTVGLSVGSWLCFLLGRWLGRPFVEKLIPRSVLDKFDFLVNNRGAFLAFIFFAIPGFPKDYMCYVLGLSPLRTGVFLFVATVGRIPGTIILGLQGANVYEERYGVFFTLLIGVLILGALAAYFAEPIRIWLRGKVKG